MDSLIFTVNLSAATDHGFTCTLLSKQLNYLIILKQTVLEFISGSWYSKYTVPETGLLISDTTSPSNGSEIRPRMSPLSTRFPMSIRLLKMDGIELLKHIRESGNYTPVILLTAKSEIEDRITGLDAGADDYLTKPFAMGELLARLRSMTRRNTSYMPSRLQVGSVTLDTEEQEMRSENSIRLAGKEARLMEYLMQNVGKALPTGTLFDRIWGKDEKAEPKVVTYYLEAVLPYCSEGSIKLIQTQSFIFLCG